MCNKNFAFQTFGWSPVTSAKRVWVWVGFWRQTFLWANKRHCGVQPCTRLTPALLAPVDARTNRSFPITILLNNWLNQHIQTIFCYHKINVSKGKLMIDTPAELKLRVDTGDHHILYLHGKSTFSFQKHLLWSEFGSLFKYRNMRHRKQMRKWIAIAFRYNFFYNISKSY